MPHVTIINNLFIVRYFVSLRHERWIVGDISPLFYYSYRMIGEKDIRQIIESKDSEKDFFIVDLSVKPINKIQVYIDSLQGITIAECAEVSKFIERTLLEKDLDFELVVSSPGLDFPFRVPQQYEKNLGKKVTITDLKGEKIIGILKKATDSYIEIEKEEKVAIPGRKKKEMQLKIEKISLQEIKTTKIFISFN